MARRGWRIRKVKWNSRSREGGTTVGLLGVVVLPLVWAVPLAAFSLLPAREGTM